MVRGAVVGCGDIVGEVHMPAWHAIPEVRLDAVCDTNSERRMAFACKHNLNEKSYSSMHDLLEKEPDLNFVTIATPGFTHYELCREAIDAGVHVLVEKPLTLRMEEALDLQERAQKQGVKVCVGHTYRFREPVIRAKEACEQGLVGEIYQVNVIHHGESLFHASEPPWRYKEHENKVLLYELAIHFLDLQVYFAGPVREILFLKADYNPHLKANTRVYALVEHTSGAVGIVDYQVFASSNYSHFEIFAPRTTSGLNSSHTIIGFILGGLILWMSFIMTSFGSRTLFLPLLAEDFKRSLFRVELFHTTVCFAGS